MEIDNQHVHVSTRNSSNIENLIRELESSNPGRRISARNKLVGLGKAAVPHLIRLLSDPYEQLRWEACKALASIRDPRSATHLVPALGDMSLAVRWVAAEGLVALGEEAEIPLLQYLMHHFNSLFIREGAHHVLHELDRVKGLTPEEHDLMETLRPMAPAASVGVMARKALLSLGHATP